MKLGIAKAVVESVNEYDGYDVTWAGVLVLWGVSHRVIDIMRGGDCMYSSIGTCDYSHMRQLVMYPRYTVPAVTDEHEWDLDEIIRRKGWYYYA